MFILGSETRDGAHFSNDLSLTAAKSFCGDWRPKKTIPIFALCLWHAFKTNQHFEGCITIWALINIWFKTCNIASFKVCIQIKYPLLCYNCWELLQLKLFIFLIQQTKEIDYLHFFYMLWPKETSERIRSPTCSLF